MEIVHIQLLLLIKKSWSVLSRINERRRNFLKVALLLDFLNFYLNILRVGHKLVHAHRDLVGALRHRLQPDQKLFYKSGSIGCCRVVKTNINRFTIDKTNEKRKDGARLIRKYLDRVQEDDYKKE